MAQSNSDSEGFEKELRKTERLSSIVVGLALVALILAFF